MRVYLSAILLASALATSSCAYVKPATRPLATSLRELVPHSDRDHFVFVVEQATGQGFEPSALQVEHISTLDKNGNFEVTISEDGLATGRVQIHDDGNTLWIVSEDDYTRALRLAYDPPLPYLQVPLMAGEKQATASVYMTQLGSTIPAGTLKVTQTTTASAAPAGQWRGGAYERAVQLRTSRRLQGQDGDFELVTTITLVPGLGEIRSEGGMGGAVATRRSLVCARVDGRASGDCAAYGPRGR